MTAYSVTINKGIYDAQDPEAKLKIFCGISDETLKAVDSSQAFLTILWPDKNPRIIFQHKDKRHEMTVQHDDNCLMLSLNNIATYVNCHELTSYEIKVTKEIWQQGYKNLSRLSRGKKQLLLPICGFEHDQYFDGWLCHCDENANFLSAVPPGTYFSFGFTLPSASTAKSKSELFEQMPPFSEIARQCIKQALREKLSRHPKHYHIEGFDLEEAVLLNLIRQSFPDKALQVSASTSYKDWNKPWKHLRTALGLEVVEDPHSPVKLITLKPLLSGVSLDQLVTEINRYSEILAPFLSKK